MTITDDLHRRENRRGVINADFPLFDSFCRADEFRQGVLFARRMHECYKDIKALLADSFWSVTADLRESMRAEMAARRLSEIGVLIGRLRLLRSGGDCCQTSVAVLAAVAYSINLEKQAEDACVADICRSIDDANEMLEAGGNIDVQ